MDNYGAKGSGTNTASRAVQVCFRLLAIAATAAATWFTVTSRQSALVYGLTFEAKYSFSPTFKFFAYANAISSAFVLVSILLACCASRKGASPSGYFVLFLGDLCVMTLLMAACAAATAEGNLGKKGNTHAGWMPLCQYVDKYCKRMSLAVMFSFGSFFCLFLLTILSASKSRRSRI